MTVRRQDADLPSQHYRLDGPSHEPVVTAGDDLGFAFGVAELAQSTWNGTVHIEHPGATRSPLTPHRTMYFNVAFGFTCPGVTADTWSDEEWRSVVDWLLTCRYDRIAFYLWSSQGFATAASTIEPERNRALRKRLGAMTDYAHQRGMAVDAWVAPMNIAPDILAARPDLQAPAPYPPGYATLCPNAPGALDFAVAVWREELATYPDADAFCCWLYDPGGCWCDRCKANPTAAAISVLDAFARLLAEHRPGKAIDVSAWPVWANEPEFGVRYRDDFVAALAAWRQDHPTGAVLDTPVQPGNVLPDLGRRGLRTQGFYLGTNIETGWCLLQPSLELVERMAADARTLGLDAVVPMRIEEGTRWAQDAFIGAALWEPAKPISAIVQQCCRAWTGDADEGDRLAHAITEWDALLRQGARNRPVRLTPLLEHVTGIHAPNRARIATLKAQAAVIDALADDNSPSVDDPMLAPLADLIKARWDEFAEYVAVGQDAQPF